MLARSPECGVDLFVRKARSLLVFLQGHPEYEADTLAREYRRDLMRFLRGEAAAAPRLPADYYPPDAAAAVANFAAPRRWRRPKRPWRQASPSRRCRSTTRRGAQAGVQLVHNWLGLVARRKAARSAATFAVARWGG